MNTSPLNKQDSTLLNSNSLTNPALVIAKSGYINRKTGLLLSSGYKFGRNDCNDKKMADRDDCETTEEYSSMDEN